MSDQQWRSRLRVEALRRAWQAAQAQAAASGTPADAAAAARARAELQSAQLEDLARSSRGRGAFTWSGHGWTGRSR